MEEYKKFGELTRDEKLALMTAWVDGEKIQFSYGNRDWRVVAKPEWSSAIFYRTAPKPVVKPSINWDHVAEKYVALAVHGDGKPFLYGNYDELRPAYGEFWGLRRAEKLLLAGFASFSPGSFTPNKDDIVENWQDSLVFRPGYEPKGETK